MATIRNSPIFLRLIVILLAGLLSSCGGGSSSGGGTALGAPPSSTAVSAVIGSAGGSLTSSDGNATLTVPAGALANDTKITMTEVSGSDIPTELQNSLVLKVYDMQPDGLQFAVPATMEVHTLGSPSPPDGVPIIGLISDHQGELNELTPLTNSVDDTGITVSAPISHFSDIATFKSENFTVTLGVVPSSLPVGDNFTLSMGVTKSPDNPSKATVKTLIDRPDPYVSLPDNFSSPSFTLIAGQPQVITRSATGSCDSKKGEGIHQLVVEGSTDQLILNNDIGDRTSLLFNYALESSVRFLFIGRVFVECTKSSAPPPATVATGLHNNPGGLTKSERAVFLGSAFANLTGGALAAFAGAEGYVVADLTTGEVKRSKNGVGPFFGAGPISQDPPGPNSSASFFPYGSSSFLDNYYTSDGDFSNFVLTFPPNVSITDVSNAGGSLTADEQVYVDNFGVHFISYDATAGSYQPTSDLIDASNFFSMQVAASEMTAGGPVLVVTRNLSGNGALYVASHDGSSVTYVGEIGPDARGIACKLFVCAVPSFAGDELTIVLWDGINPPTIIGNETVGDGPVDVDLKTLDSDHVLIGSTGFNDNTSTFTVIKSDGSTVSNATQPVDNGCIHPGHVTFIDDQEALITCYDSNNYDIQDTKAFETVP